MNVYEDITGLTEKELLNIISDAAEYIIAKERMKLIESDIFSKNKELDYIQNRIESTRRRISDLEQNIKLLSLYLEETNKTLITCKNEKEQTETQYAKTQELIELSNELDSVRKEHDHVCFVFNISLKNEQKTQKELEEILTLKQWFENEKEVYALELKRIMEEILTLEEKKNELTQTIHDYTDSTSLKIKENEANIEVNKYKASIEKLNKKLIEINKEITKSSAELETLTTQKQILLDKTTELNQKINELELYENKETLEEQLKKLTEEKNNLTTRLENNKKELTKQNDLIKELENTINEELELKKNC
ncbi:hypothetical protein MCHI_003366, partial [Candidatus Magnetoovum chiemensis]